jgi:glycosyltransferase involved in cell wall biosynthesis
MKIAFLIREDYLILPGGDVIMMNYIANYLSGIGCTVEINPINLDDFHIIHLFNIQKPYETLFSIEKLPLNIPRVFSPVFWDSRFVIKNRRLVYFKELLKSTFFIFLFRKYCASLKVINNVDYFVFNSIAELEGFNYSYNFNVRSKAIVIPNVIDVNKFFKFQDFDNRNYDLICVGRIEKAKGQNLLLESISGLNLKVLFIGKLTKDDYGNEFKNLQLNSGNYVHHIDFVNNFELCNYYNNAKVHILLSQRESPGLVNMEALCCGCNLVVSSNGPVNEYFGENCYFTDLNKVAIKYYVLKALDNRLHKDYSSYYRSKFSLSSLEMYYKLYNKILNK